MFQLIPLIKAVGYIGVGGIIFSESGLLVGFFLPGDSLLFTAGLLASQGYLNIVLLILASFIGAVVGDSVGYAIGKSTGPRIFNKQESIWFHPDHVVRANAFFERYGAKAIIFARFLPIVRTFVPVIAGIGKMRYRTFLFSNIIGGFLWTVGVALAGFYLGQIFPGIQHYLLPIILLIVVLSFLPTAIHILRDKNARVQIAKSIKNIRDRKK
jgi:membrane-associated protein